MEQIGRWILEERIGVGGVADVWRAVDPVSRQHVALKMLREPDRSAAHRDRFLREGRLLQRLASPGLPRIYEMDDGPRPFLAIELLIGETLGERIRSRVQLTPVEVEAIAAALLQTLGMLHARGVIHRDIKSSNIFLCDDGRVLVLDLGLAANPHDPLRHTTLGDVMGTYAYMAPEQIAGAEVDLRCDLYSAGVTLYEALAGSRPFHAADAAGYLRAHREGRAPPLSARRPDAPARLVGAIMRMMARDPAARPVSAPVALAMLTGTGGTRRTLARPPIVGRGAALGAVQAILDGGGVVAVIGETGSGTGRIATYALEEARTMGCETIAVRCSRRAPPTDPLYQLARDLSQILSIEVGPNPATLRDHIADLAAEGPLFVLVESIEQCSEAAARAFAEALRPGRGLAVLYTGVDMAPGIQAHIVNLRPLNRDEVHELLAGMLGSHGVPAGLTEALHEMSGGLPAVVALAARELTERGALEHAGISDEGESVWHLDRAGGLVPTVGLARLFGEVLLRLPSDGLALLEVLAVAGGALPVQVALEAAGGDPDAFVDGTLLAESLVVLQQTGGEEWLAIRRPAVGALVMAQTTEALQADIHRRIAGALARLPEAAWRDELLEWHMAHGASADQAPHQLLELGTQLLAGGQAARALEVLDRISQNMATDELFIALVATARGEALATLGQSEAAWRSYQAALELAQAMGDGQLCARVLVLLSELHLSGADAPASLPLALQALELLEQHPTAPLLPRALLAAASAYSVGAQPEEASRMYHQCINEGMTLGQNAYAAMAHGGLGLLLAEAGRLDDAIRHLEQEVAILRVETLPARLVGTLYRLSQIQLRRGEIRLALEALDEAERVAELAHLPYEVALASIGRAAVVLQVGDRARATTLLRSARIALEPDAPAPVRLAYRLIQGELRTMSGDHQAALAAFQVAESEAMAAGFVALGAFCLGMAGVLTADAEALMQAMGVLGHSGDRSLCARLLLHGARVGGDVEVLRSAEAEARASHDLFVLLTVLHAMGSDETRKEARGLVRQISGRLPDDLRVPFLANPPVAWALTRGAAPEPGWTGL